MLVVVWCFFFSVAVFNQLPASSGTVQSWRVFSHRVLYKRNKIYIWSLSKRVVPKIGNVQFIMSFGGVHPTRWWFQLFLYVHKKNGEMIQFDEHIFEMGGGGGYSIRTSDHLRVPPLFCITFLHELLYLCQPPLLPSSQQFFLMADHAHSQAQLRALSKA